MSEVMSKMDRYVSSALGSAVVYDFSPPEPAPLVSIGNGDIDVSRSKKVLAAHHEQITILDNAEEAWNCEKEMQRKEKF